MSTPEHRASIKAAVKRYQGLVNRLQTLCGELEDLREEERDYLNDLEEPETTKGKEAYKKKCDQCEEIMSDLDSLIGNIEDFVNSEYESDLVETLKKR